MAASRHTKHNYVKQESKVHRLWREESTRFHQNMYEGFCSGPNKLGYHAVKKGDDLKEKIRLAIYGCDSDSKDLKENDKKMIMKLAEKIEKYSPPIVFGQKNLSVVAIIFAHVLLNNENAENEKHVLFRVPKFVKNMEVKDITFFDNKAKVEYSSGQDTVYDLNDCEAYFIDGALRVYYSWEEYKQDNKLPEGKLCAPKGGVYRTGEDNRVLVEIVDTPAHTDKGGALELFDASSSLLGKVGAGICLTSMFTPVGAVVCWTGVGLVTASSFYSCGRSTVKLLDRAIHDQEMNLADTHARHLWIDAVMSGVATVAGCKMLSEGYVALRANNFKVAASSSELAAIYSRNTSWIVATSTSGVLQVVINRVIDNVILGDWSDLPNLKNLLCLFLNIFSPVEEIKETLNQILTVTKPFFNIASSMAHYLKLSFDKLKIVVVASAADLWDIAVISGKFLFNVSVGLLDKRFTEIHDSFKDLLTGRITLVAFALNIVKHSSDIFSWFELSFNNAKEEYRKLCDRKNAKHILETVDMENEENMRKMFQELEEVIQVCKVSNTDNKHMASLIKLVDTFRSKLDADCNANEFLFSVKVVCAFVKKCFKEKESKYENEFKFARDLNGDLFDRDDFNERFGLSLEAGGHDDTAAHFFAQSVALLQTNVQLEEMQKMYEKMTANNANKAIPSIQTEDFQQYLFVKPSEVTDVSKDEMWLNFFKAQTGIAVDEHNVQIDRETAEGKYVILIRPKSNSNLKFKLAYFMAEVNPILKGMLCVCKSVKED